MFQLTDNKWANLKPQSVTSSWSGRRTLTYVYTEQAVAMLSSVLRTREKEVKMVLASKLSELGKLTSGQVAELAGYSKETFMELLADYGVSFFNYPPEELDKDIRNAENHSPRHQLYKF